MVEAHDEVSRSVSKAWFSPNERNRRANLRPFGSLTVNYCEPMPFLGESLRREQIRTQPHAR